MNVKTICTTDDPADSLEHHKKITDDGLEIPVLPAWRPDNAMNVSNAQNSISYVEEGRSGFQYFCQQF